MTELPLISVALCTYRGERFLRQQLDSILAQDYPRLEVVAVDDASGDGTPGILEACAARDPRVRFHRNPANLGFVRNFERAFGLCRGELVAPADQDDVWLPHKLRVMQRALGASPAVACDSEIVDEQGRVREQRMSARFHVAPVSDAASFAFENRISGHAFLFRRELLDLALPVPEGLYHDWWLGFVASCAGRIEVCDEVLVRHREHERSVTRDPEYALGRAPPRGGSRLAAIAGVEHRLRAFAAFPRSPDPTFYASLLRLWLSWEEQLVSPRLAAFLLRHRHRLFAFRRDERLRHARLALQYLWGLRLKRALNPRAYGAG
jgi:glycosyltransferase involved in cell wall biosynthesis